MLSIHLRRFGLHPCILLVVTFSAFAQDEGTITKKARVTSKATTVYLGLGPTLPLAGDYGVGLHLNAGFVKRLNRFVSVGPSISYTKLTYDAAKSDSFKDSGARGNNIYVEEGGYEIWIAHFEGGDLGLISAGVDFKFNFTPSERIKQFSLYALARPFVLFAGRSAITSDSEVWYRDDVADTDPSLWYYSGTTDHYFGGDWEAETKIAGGLNVGLGGEWISSSGLSVFLQSSLGVTSPVSYIDTKIFKPTFAGFNDRDFPFAKKSLPLLNISLGVGYTF